ncbi:MAG: CBS domain-containing protein [Polyangiaceae bacterium]
MLQVQQGPVTATNESRQRTSVLRYILDTKAHHAVLSITQTAPVLDTVDKLCEGHVGALLVMQDTHPIGILSERDLLTRVLLKRLDPARTRVSEVMTRDVVAVSIDATPEEVMAIMTERRCRHLPVIENDSIVGIISIGDVVRWASRTQEFQIQSLEDYICGKYPG